MAESNADGGRPAALDSRQAELWHEARRLDAEAVQHHYRATVFERRAAEAIGRERMDRLAAALLEREMGDQAAGRAALIRRALSEA